MILPVNLCHIYRTLSLNLIITHDDFVHLESRTTIIISLVSS